MSSESWRGPIRGQRILVDGKVNLPSSPGIYIWKRSAPSAPKALVDPADFREWWASLIFPSLVNTPSLALDRVTSKGKVAVRKNFVRLESVSIGGRSEMSEKNKDYLENFVNDGEKREIFHNRLSMAQNEHGAVLYVGESESLADRLWAHANGQTGLLTRLEEVGLTLDHLSVFYLEMPESDKSERTFIEESLCYSLYAPLTLRPG